MSKLPELEALLERLPEDAREAMSIAEKSAGYQARNRQPTLGWLAMRCAEYGLTDSEIIQVIQHRNGLWKGGMKWGASLYRQYSMYLDLVDAAREKFPKVGSSGVHDDFTEEAQ